MGRLFTEEDTKGSWSAWNVGEIGRFGHMLYWITVDKIWHYKYSPPNHVIVRKFIENSLEGDVLVLEDNMMKQSRESSWNNSGYGNIYYYVIHFELASDAVAFKLRFSDDIQNEHYMGLLRQKKTQYELDMKEKNR